MTAQLLIQGRQLGCLEMAQNRSMPEENPSWNRTRLSRHLCLLWNWPVENWTSFRFRAFPLFGTISRTEWREKGRKKRISNIEQGISNDEVEKPSNLELNSVLERFLTSLLDIPCSILDIHFHVFDGSFSPQIQYG